jgi:hypothetical protein
VIGHLPQQRFNVQQVIPDAAEFLRRLAVTVAGPGRQPRFSVASRSISMAISAVTSGHPVRFG